MTNQEKFRLCLQQANQIVSAYRAEAPEGCDPQNSGITIAVGLGGAALSAGGAYYSSQQANKQQQQQQQAAKDLVRSRMMPGFTMEDLPDEAAFREAYGRVPEAALFNPVDFDKQQALSILGNLNNLPNISNLVYGTNNLITQDATNRATSMIPGYRKGMKQYGRNARHLMRGELPWDDVMGIVGERNDLAGALGTPGASAPATMRDLGVSRLDAMKTGGGMFKDMVQIAETISPRSSYMNPQDQFTSPMDRIGFNFGQNQVIQQSQQGANNLAASGDPTSRAMLEAEIALLGSQQGEMPQMPTGPSGPDPATAALMAGLGSLGGVGASYLGGMGGGGGSTVSPYGWSGDYSRTGKTPAYFNGYQVPRATATSRV